VERPAGTTVPVEAREDLIDVPAVRATKWDLVADSGLLFLHFLSLTGLSALCAPTEMGSAPDGCLVSGR
jgi:hypothetical protein